jgi:hypothetical protein
MDEIELLVNETYKHFNQHYSEEELEDEFENYGMREESENELPNGPGLLYHLQKSSSIFVIRTFASKNIREDYERVLEAPEDYPSLRLIDTCVENIESRLRFFMVDNPFQAEIIHDQVANRRFPINEEVMCNISDPGFSWWLTPKRLGFQLSFTMSVGIEEMSTKLGPLGDQQLALKTFQQMSALMNDAGLELNIQNETNRVQFSEGEELLLEELKDLFEYGVISEGLTQLFKLLARQSKRHSELETLWFYLQELAAMRRFWIQVQYDLNANN